LKVSDCDDPRRRRGETGVNRKATLGSFQRARNN
jgi:hypothetical protein